MRIIMLFAAMLMLAGCGSSRPVRDVQPQGFLGDYSQLTRGGEGEAALRYVNPDADWASYDKVIVEPVTVWAVERPTHQKRTSRPLPTTSMRNSATSSARTSSWSTSPAPTRFGSRRP